MNSEFKEPSLLLVKVIQRDFEQTYFATAMSSFLPSITVGKSSLVAAKRIYSATDFLDGTASKGRAGKKRSGRKRNRAHSMDQTPHQKAERTKEYSQDLRTRREKARIARDESLAERQNIKELKERGLREKKRLNQLFSVYAVQQGSAYRDSAKVVKPKFPILLKSTKSARSTAISREKIPYQSSPLPNLSSFNRLERDTQE